MEYSSHCGYCSSLAGSDTESETSVSRGLFCPNISVEDYQRMIDFGWRRSGCFLYEPVIEKTCCPLQSIRMNAFTYEMTGNQRRSLLKFFKFMKIEYEGSLSFDKLSRCELVDKVLYPMVESGRMGEVSYELKECGDLSEMFDLYKKYQIAVHRDTAEELNVKRFSEFLIKNPFKKTDDNDDEQGSRRGTKYAEMRHGGKLLGVGVVDILSRSISSVYFFYDPEYQDLSLGTVSCILEICLTRLLFDRAIIDEPYYYLGYYLPTCPKLQYKSTFKPYQILNRTTQEWEDKA